MDRTTIIRGPAVLKLGATILYTEEDLTVTAEVNTTEGKNAVAGKYDEFMDTVIHTISFKPASQATAEYFTALFPYQNPTLGAMLYGAAPPDLIVWSVDGKQYTYKQAALTAMPGLAFAPNLPLFDGDATFTAIGDAAEAWSGVDHFASVASVAFTDSSFDKSKDLRLHYPISWGGIAPWVNIETESGIKCSFDLQTEDVMSDSYGLVDKSITGLVVTATFTPQGITPEEVLAALGVQGAGAQRGRSMSGLGKTLSILTSEVGDPTLTVNGATLKGSATQFGAGINRVGELTLTSLAGIGSGAVFNVDIFSV